MVQEEPFQPQLLKTMDNIMVQQTIMQDQTIDRVQVAVVTLGMIGIKATPTTSIQVIQEEALPVITETLTCECHKMEFAIPTP